MMDNPFCGHKKNKYLHNILLVKTATQNPANFIGILKMDTKISYLNCVS